MSSQANTAPRALVHKRILTAAAERPEASLEEIADEVTGASTPLVERVLEEYGDPAEDDADSTAMSQQDLPIDIDELSSAQRETLAVVLEHPDATQQEVATKLDVSSATVSQRLRDIEGFDWAERGPIVAELAERDVSLPGVASPEEDAEAESDDSPENGPTDESTASSVEPSEPDDMDESTAVDEATQDAAKADEEPAEDVTGDIDEVDEVEADTSESPQDVGAEVSPEASSVDASVGQEIERRLTALEETVAATRTEMESVLERGISELEADIEETIADGGQLDPRPAIQDDELVAKVIRASMADDTITEDEELRIIEALR